MSAAMRSTGSSVPSRMTNDERLLPNCSHRLGQGRGEQGQHGDGLAHVAVHGRDPDAEPGGELGGGVTAPQVRQSEQGLAARGQPSPSCVDLPSASGELTGRVRQGAGGQIDRRRIDKQAKLLAGNVDLGRDTVYQELFHAAGRANWRTSSRGWKRLNDPQRVLDVLVGAHRVVGVVALWRAPIPHRGPDGAADQGQHDCGGCVLDGGPGGDDNGALPVCLGAQTHVGFKEGDQGDGDSAQEAENVMPSGKVACETRRCAKNKGEQYPEENPRGKSFTNGTVSSRWNGRVEVLERVIRYDGDR